MTEYFTRPPCDPYVEWITWANMPNDAPLYDAPGKNQTPCGSLEERGEPEQ